MFLRFSCFLGLYALKQEPLSPITVVASFLWHL